MRVRVVQWTRSGLFRIQRRTMFGNWRDIGGDELASAQCISSIGQWVFETEGDARKMAEKYQGYCDRPFGETRVVGELPERSDST